DPALTNRKYRGALLEVSGLFMGLEKKESVRPPVRPHAVLAAAGRSVCCDLLGSPTPERDWNAIARRQPATVRGAYSSDCFLHGCVLLPPAPPADTRYKGKVIELTGFGDAVLLGDFPTVKLERDTGGAAEIRCLFRKTDAAAVKNLRPLDQVTVRGTCNGRHSIGGLHFVRLDNCELVHTSAPVPPAPRLDPAAVLPRH